MKSSPGVGGGGGANSSSPEMVHNHINIRRFVFDILLHNVYELMETHAKFNNNVKFEHHAIGERG